MCLSIHVLVNLYKYLYIHTHLIKLLLNQPCEKGIIQNQIAVVKKSLTEAGDF